MINIIHKKSRVVNKKDNSEVDNNSDNIKKNIIEKDKGGRPLKNLKFANERKIVLDKLLKILGITKENNIFYVDELDKDSVKIKEILNLETEIKQYFSCSGWTCFTKNCKNKKYLSLIKSLLKNMNVTISSVSLTDTQTRKVIKQGYKVGLQ